MAFFIKQGFRNLNVTDGAGGENAKSFQPAQVIQGIGHDDFRGIGDYLASIFDYGFPIQVVTALMGYRQVYLMVFVG